MHEHVLSASAGPHEARPHEAGQQELAAAESTGDQAVDAALTRLDGLSDLAVREHVGVFEAVHGALQERLADVEE